MELNTVILPFGKIIYQTKQGQSVSDDNSYLINTVLEKEPEGSLSLLDLGSGNGILSIMLGFHRPNWTITGIEIQSHLVELARQNCRSADISNIEFYKQDLRTWSSQECFDIIVGNPPYFPQESGRISPVREKAISRHEIFCNMTDVLHFIKKHLKSQGRAYLIYPSNRASDMENISKKVDLNIDGKFFFNKNKKGKIIFSLSHQGRMYVKNR